jgi:hypothetical protein
LGIDTQRDIKEHQQDKEIPRGKNLPFGMYEIISGKVTAGAGVLPRTVREGVTSPSVMTIN